MSLVEKDKLFTVEDGSVVAATELDRRGYKVPYEQVVTIVQSLAERARINHHLIPEIAQRYLDQIAIPKDSDK